MDVQRYQVAEHNCTDVVTYSDNLQLLWSASVWTDVRPSIHHPTRCSLRRHLRRSPILHPPNVSSQHSTEILSHLPSNLVGARGEFTRSSWTSRNFWYENISHFKPTKVLKLVYVIIDIIAKFQDILKWVRDHRVHHKYTDTDADPHNSKRGFFFSHMGWLLIKKHPDVKRIGAKVDMSDLDQDPALLFQRK